MSTRTRKRRTPSDVFTAWRYWNKWEKTCTFSHFYKQIYPGLPTMFWMKSK